MIFKRASCAAFSQQKIVDDFFSEAETKGQDLYDVMHSLGFALQIKPGELPAWQVTCAYFDAFGALHDQGEPVSQLYHAMKSLHGAMLLFVDLPSDLCPIYKEITGVDWAPGGVESFIPDIKIFLQALLVHDLAQVAVNGMLAKCGHLPETKADALNDRHDALGGALLSRKGLFSKAVADYVTFHGDAKLDNSDHIKGYHLSDVSQKTAVVRRDNVPRPVGFRVDVPFRLMRFIEDYLGKTPQIPIPQCICEVAHHDLFKDVFPNLSKQDRPDNAYDQDSLMAFMRGALIRDLFL